MTKVFIKPVGTATIIDPETNKAIPSEGAEITDGKYVRRRIADGDAVIVKPTSKKSN